MTNQIIYWIGISLSLMVFSCTTYQSMNSNSSGYNQNRIIILEGDTLSESDYGKFITWKCRAYVYGGPTLVEVGYFEKQQYGMKGFILFDGSNSGERTFYQRAGINHRWDWGKYDLSYSFIIKPDGTGLVYDFSSVPDGESTKAKDVFKCRQ